MGRAQRLETSFVESANFEPAGCEYLQAKVRKPTLPRSMCQSDTEYRLKDAGPPKVQPEGTTPSLEVDFLLSAGSRH
jgi:hypothetical protein